MNADKIYAESLVNEYTPKNTSKAASLKKLDARAKRPANVTAFSLGNGRGPQLRGRGPHGVRRSFRQMGLTGWWIAVLSFSVVTGERH